MDKETKQQLNNLLKNLKDSIKETNRQMYSKSYTERNKRFEHNYQLPTRTDWERYKPFLNQIVDILEILVDQKPFEIKLDQIERIHKEI